MMQVSDYIAKKYGRTEFPREELINGRIDDLGMSDLLAVIIGTGSKHESVFALSERIIREYGSKSISETKDPNQISSVMRISPYKAAKIVAAFELGRRFYGTGGRKKLIIRGPEDIYEYAKDMKTLVKEHFRGIYLNSKNCIIHDENISVGSLTGTLVHPREVFKSAIECAAGSIIVVHNHPSGEFEPSEHDDGITRMLKESGDILQIPLVDHVIIAENGYYSYNKERKV